MRVGFPHVGGLSGLRRGTCLLNYLLLAVEYRNSLGDICLQNDVIRPNISGPIFHSVEPKVNTF